MCAAAYVRVSTKGQVEHGYSLPEQRAILTAYCERKGYEVVEVVEDAGQSGRLAERPGLQRVRALAAAGEVDYLVAVHLDRLGRENRLIQDALHAARSRGVRVEFVEHASGDTASDRLLLNVLGGVAEFQWEQVRKLTMEGRRSKAKQRGVMPNGRAPFGYRAISVAEAQVVPEYAGRSGEYLIVEAEAVIARELFRRYAAGSSLRGLETWLIEEGVEPPGGGQFWRSSVQRLLRNPAYVGKPVCNRVDQQRVEEDGKVRYTRRLRPPEEWIELSCPALVDEALFAAVQQRLDVNRENLRGRRSDKWPLAAHCGVCKTPRGLPRFCRGSDDLRCRNARRYVCSSQLERGVPFCGAKIKADDLEELARLALVEAATPGRLAALERQRAEETLAQAGNPAARMEACQRELSNLDTEEEKLLDLALAGFSRAAVEARLATINGKRKQLRTELADAGAAVARLEAPDQAATRAESVATSLRAALADPHRFAELARLLLRITIFPDRSPSIEVRVPAALWEV